MTVLYRNPYHTHPDPHPPPAKVSMLPGKLQRRCIAGTAEQIECSEKKARVANYHDSGWRFLFRLRGTLFQNSWKQVLIVLIISIVVTLTHQQLDDWVRFGDKPHTLTVLPIGFLLVFRSNLSYGRWWDGRRMISQMVYSSRCILGKTLSYIKGDPDKKEEVVIKVAQLTMAMVVAIRHSVQKRSSGETEFPEEAGVAQALNELRMWELHHYLSESQMQELSESSGVSPVIVISNMLCRTITDVTDMCSVQYKWPTAIDCITPHVENLLFAWQGMMKIVTTPMPFPYAHSLEIFLTVWLYTVPLVMIDKSINMGWLTIPVSTTIALLLFGINNVGAEIEDPFGNDVNDFDLVKFQRMLHVEMVTFSERPEDIWAK